MRRRRLRRDAPGIACQLLFAASEGGAVLLDVIALEPVVEGDEEVPAGTPVTLLLEPDGGPGSASHDLLVRTVERWAEADSVFRFVSTSGSDGQRYVLASGSERLVLEVAR
jgi:hypothetical protein